jgi:hypothetical protein
MGSKLTFNSDFNHEEKGLMDGLMVNRSVFDQRVPMPAFSADTSKLFHQPNLIGFLPLIF